MTASTKIFNMTLRTSKFLYDRRNKKVGKWQLPQIVFKRQEEGKKIKCHQEIEFYR